MLSNKGGQIFGFICYIKKNSPHKEVDKNANKYVAIFSCLVSYASKFQNHPEELYVIWDTKIIFPIIVDYKNSMVTQQIKGPYNYNTHLIKKT